MSGDTPRLLHRHPAYGYTPAPSVAMRGEPEALSADDLERLTERAHRERVDAIRREWRKTSDRAGELLGHFEEVAGDALGREVRAVRRQLAAVDRHAAQL